MKIVLLASTRFGYSCLETLISMGVEIAGVLTTAPRIDISYAPEGVNIVNFIDFEPLCRSAKIPLVRLTEKMVGAKDIIAGWQPDLILACGWYYNVGPSIRNLARLGCAGFHCSLLPRYSGGAPVNWTIINGENRTGISFFFFDDGVDTGDIIAQRSTPVTLNDTCATVYGRLTGLAREILQEKLPLLLSGKLTPTRQDLSLRTEFPQRKPADGRIDWRNGSLAIYNFIRAQTMPYPGAFTFFNGHTIKIWAAKIFDFSETHEQGGRIMAIHTSPPYDGVVVSGAGHDTPLLLTSISIDDQPPRPAAEVAEELSLAEGRFFEHG